MFKKSSSHTMGANDEINLAEEVLRMGGASEEEIARTAAMDASDDRLEESFAAQYRTTNSPMHRAVWDDVFPFNLFKAHLLSEDEPCHAAMKDCLQVVRKHKEAGTLYDAENKVAPQVLKDLGATGYWGMLIERQFGGQGASKLAFSSFLTSMSATGDPTTAGLASIHGCIGAVDPVKTYGNDRQKQYFLPRLAAGQTISGFALTEPNAGSDLTALRTVFTQDGEDIVVNGEKLFISNSVPGRTIGLVGKMHGQDKKGNLLFTLPIKNKNGKLIYTMVLAEVKDEGGSIHYEDRQGRRFAPADGVELSPKMVPSVLIVELPAEENEHFQVVRYGLWALAHTYNNGLKFNNFRVPKGNLLHIENGDGLTIAYHGLNLGRLALCSNAAGVMRFLLRSITPKSWGEYRKTYGQSIEKRELVLARIARLAGLIVGADALAAWCASLLDEGYRGELECIVAKIFGSEAQKEAAIEIAMKTHGGRSFLKGHIVGDNMHDYLAPCIYEGEGQMLSMALFKTLAKNHGMRFMLPLGKGMMRLQKTLPKTSVIAAVPALLLAIASFVSGSPLVPGAAAALLGGVLGFSQTSAFKGSFRQKVKSLLCPLGTGAVFGLLGLHTGVWLSNVPALVPGVVAGLIGLIAAGAAAAPLLKESRSWPYRLMLGTGMMLLGPASGMLVMLFGLMCGVGPLLQCTVTALSVLVLSVMAAGHYGFIKCGIAYVLWFANKMLPRRNRKQKGTDPRLAKHLAFAQKMFRKLPVELSRNMIKHQLALADRQGRLIAMSSRVQDTITIAVTAQYAQQKGDEATIMAADVLCRQLRMKLTGQQPGDADFAAYTRLGKLVVEGNFRQLDGVPETAIMRPYEQQ